MLRAAALVLLLVNLLVLGWTQGLFDKLRGTRADADREPERLQRQVNADQVRVLPAPAASAALAAAQAAAASEAEAAVRAAAAPPGTCLEAGPVPATALAAAEKLLRDNAGLSPGSWTPVSSERKGVFLIYMGKYADEETLGRKIEEVKRLRLDPKPMSNSPELEPGLVLGRFDDKTAAEAELGRLSQRGLRTARVITLVPAVPLVTLRVPNASDAQRDKLSGLKLPNNGPAFAACTLPKS
ncbi:hypothetical protein [Aquabacterium sp.]|uniref:hypothetical protein n=1 Tax=Aquabacterium sp. TaxID=1872578 RepID=UPI002C372F9B|nr:hypothetical protein [Aquabacterium sp.]HSW07862.1 hypothetical protein [Aquabacterium sp.]